MLDQQQQPQHQHNQKRPSTAASNSNSTQGQLARETSPHNKPCWLPAGVQGITQPASPCRPVSAPAAGSTAASKQAALAKLKAELAAAAAGSNLQRSLRPCAEPPADASAELQAQVLEQLASLDVSLTYTQARSAAAASSGQHHHKAPPVLPAAHAPAQHAARRMLQHSSSSSNTSAARGSRRHHPEQQHMLSHLSSAGSAPVAAGSLRDPEASTAAAAEALSDMKQWAIDKELSMMEPSTTARYASKALAAHVGMLQSEAMVLRYQRQFVEAELQKLRAGFHQPQQQQHQQQQHGALEFNSGSDIPGGCAIPAATQAAAGRIGAQGESAAQPAYRLPGRRTSSDTDGGCMDSSQPDTHSSRDAQRHNSAAPSMWSGGGDRTRGSSSLTTLGTWEGTRALVLTHVGLGPKHLDRVKAALEGSAASPIQQLDLSSNLLTDSAVFDLVELLQSVPAASGISHLSLSHNQLLTWQCCAALRQLVSEAAAAAAATAAAAAGPAAATLLTQQGGSDDSASAQDRHSQHASYGISSGVQQQQGQQSPQRLQHTGSGTESNSSSAALGSSVPASWGHPQPSFRRLTQPLQLRALRLQGVAVGDKGAVLLAEALAGTHHLQELDLSRCQLNDAGGAAVCLALQQQDTLQELSLSWNALSHATACALEGLFRHPCSCSHLHLAHCSLSDRDGALILNALAERAASRASQQSTSAQDSLQDSTTSSSHHSSGSGSSSGILRLSRDWQVLDLSHNALEGGAAVVAGALLRAEFDAHDLVTGPPFTGTDSSSNTTSNGSGSLSNRGLGVLQAASKRLVLDGNPLGASGLHILMHAIAAQPAIDLSRLAPLPASTPSAAASASGQVASAGPNQQEDAADAPAPFFLPAVPQQPTVASLPREGQRQHSVSALNPVHVSISGVSLLGKDKGFRASMRTTVEAAQGFASQVPTLISAVAVAGKQLAKGIAKAPVGKPSPVASAATAMTASQAAAAASALSAITETAGGYNPCCPAGQYRLSLQHPASRHLFEQLLGLRTALQQAQQHVKIQQQQQQQQLAAAAAKALPEAAASAEAAGSKAQSRQPSRGTSPVPGAAALNRTASTQQAPGAVPSRRVSQMGSSISGATNPAKSAPKPPRLQPCVVEVPSIADIKLDGKATKLEQLLRLAPWYTPQPGTESAAAAGAEADNSSSQQQASSALDNPACAAAASSSAGGAGQGAKKKAKSYCTLEFVVKSAAVLVGAEPSVMPSRLLAWAVQVLQDTSCGEVWKLHLVELLLEGRLLDPQQAVQLLSVFDRELGADEQLLAAGLIWAHLVQPMQLWDHVLPATLRPSQQQQLERMLGPALMALDRHNLTGSFSMDLNSSMHRAVAWRLQLAALQDNATSECRYYLSWRNARLNNAPLSEEALAHLQLYGMPSSGRLQLDYVSYQVPDPVLQPAIPDAQLRALLTQLRQVQQHYSRLVLSLRQEYLPGGVRRSHEAAKAAATQAREVRDTGRSGQTGARTGIKQALLLRKSAAAAGLEGQQAAAGTSADAAATSNQQGTPSQAATPAAAGSVGQQSTRSSAVSWWAASGFDGAELLLKHQPRPPSASTTTTSTTQRSSKRATRDMAAKRPSVLGSRRQSTSSQRPASAAPAAGAAATSSAVGTARLSTSSNGAAAGKPAAAAATAATGSTGHRGTRSKLPAAASSGALQPNSGLLSGCSTGGVTDEQLLVRLLAATAPAAAAAAFARLGLHHAVAVLRLLAGRDKGSAAVAALLECLSPVVAARFVQELPGQESSLLPAAVRASVLPLLQPAAAESIQEVASSMRAAGQARDSQLLLCVRRWASQVPSLTCSQLGTVLTSLGVEGQLRCSVIVALWGKVLDRHNLVKVFEALHGSEQLGLMAALGSYYVWSRMGAPDGLHFRLDLTQPEQRDVAREVVKVAVRRTLAAGKGSRVQHLLNFTAASSGSACKPVADPEDEKLWLSLESKHTLLEFDFARTWQQELHVMEGAVKHIQRAWRSRAGARLAQQSSSSSHQAPASAGADASAAQEGCVSSSGQASRPASRPSSATSSYLYTDGGSSYTSYTVYSNTSSLYTPGECYSAASVSLQPSQLADVGGSDRAVSQQSLVGAARGACGVDLAAGLLASCTAGGVRTSQEPTPRL